MAYINKIQWLSQNETGVSGFKAIGLCFSFIFLFPNDKGEAARTHLNSNNGAIHARLDPFVYARHGRELMG